MAAPDTLWSQTRCWVNMKRWRPSWNVMVTTVFLRHL